MPDILPVSMQNFLYGRKSELREQISLAAILEIQENTDIDKRNCCKIMSTAGSALQNRQRRILW